MVLIPIIAGLGHIALQERQPIVLLEISPDGTTLAIAKAIGGSYHRFLSKDWVRGSIRFGTSRASDFSLPAANPNMLAACRFHRTVKRWPWPQRLGESICGMLLQDGCVTRWSIHRSWDDHS